MNDLNTGDLLFCDYCGKGPFGWFSSALKYFTKSKYSHIAIILRDPTFIHPSLKGLFVWESSWEGKPDPQDGKIKLGVQISPFQEFYNAYTKDSYLYCRKIKCSEEERDKIFNNSKLSEIHKVVYDKPYDIVPTDWIEAYNRTDDDPQKTSRFWCSALVGYIFTKLGILKSDTDWTILRPADFSTEITPYELEFLNIKLTNEISL